MDNIYFVTKEDLKCSDCNSDLLQGVRVFRHLDKEGKIFLVCARCYSRLSGRPYLHLVDKKEQKKYLDWLKTHDKYNDRYDG